MALGQPGQTCWSETWPLIKPFIDQVLTQGEASWSDSLSTPFYPQGQLLERYWTFNYSPVLNETGRIAGVLAVGQEASPFRDRWAESEQMSMALQAAHMGIWSVYPLEN